jgi:heme/copper-type cytochrome/quinol oxidase subunit 3
MTETILRTRALPVGSIGRHASGWWGMWCLIATEAALFAYLLFSYFYLGLQAHGPWVPELPALRLALPNTEILIASSAVLYWGETGIRKGRPVRLMIGLGGSLLMGLVFVGIQATEWHNKKFSLGDNAYASSYFTITGFHMAHVVAGLLVLAALLLWAILGKFDRQRHAAVSIGALYWHFVDIVWLAVFATFYLLPYLG